MAHGDAQRAKAVFVFFVSWEVERVQKLVPVQAVFWLQYLTWRCFLSFTARFCLCCQYGHQSFFNLLHLRAQRGQLCIGFCPALWGRRYPCCRITRRPCLKALEHGGKIPRILLHLGHAPFFNQERPITVIDLGMPRNIDPELDDLSSDITIVDLDGLKYWYRRELTDMNEILTRCRAIIAEHHELYAKITNSFKSGNAAE